MRFFLLIFGCILPGYANVLYIKQGAINGTTMEARNGRTFNAFLGIPFAEPPIGKLRFQPPQPAGSWEGVRNCTVEPLCCLQWNKHTNDNTTIGTEDCLYINVYSPLKATKGDGLAVIFYIYGGIFKTGSNVINGPQYIMGSDVIIMIPNFRGGALGFLSTGDTVIPGNFGLKDQLLALKWARENIEYFGGDPNRVTLHGHSSGAVMVHMHMLAPSSKGYFQQAIIQSGTGFCALSYFDADVSRSVAKEFAERVNCSTESSEEMLKCFMELEADAFPLVAEQMYVWNLDPDAAFRPTVEDRRVDGAFLTEVPTKMKYHSTDIPWLIGITSGEGAGKVKGFLEDPEIMEQLNEDYKMVYPISIQYLWHAKSKFLDFISTLLKTHYFGTKKLTFEIRQNISDMYTHGLFGVCSIEAIRRYKGPKHVYLYDYVSNYSLHKNTLEDPPVYLGVAHADDLSLFFEKSSQAPTFTEKDTIASKEFVKRWVNFVQSGDPNKPTKINETLISPWEPMRSKRIEYLRLKINGKMETDLYKGVYDFWKRLPLFSKYYN